MIVDALPRLLVAGVVAGGLLAGPVTAVQPSAAQPTAAQATAYPRPGATELVSAAPGGGGGDGAARDPSLSADGRHVGFVSDAANLVPGDTNGRTDVFLADRRTGAVERVSVGAAGADGTGSSFEPSVSGNGRFVAFESSSPNLVAGDTNGTWDVFVRDRQTGATVRVSDGVAGAEPDGGSDDAALSADGRFVAFSSDAGNLVPDDDNGRSDIFVHDLRTGVTRLVSHNLDGAASNGASFAPSISADGRFLVYWSAGSDMVATDTNQRSDVFWYDRERQTTELVSVGPDGQGTGHAYYASVSADGRYVAFESWASNLVPSDTNQAPDIFLRDRSAGITERVSVGTNGAEADGYSFAPSVSADGRFVAFHSLSSNLVSGDDGVPDVFVRDRRTGATELASATGDGTGGDAGSSAPALAADGSVVAFSSQASNLVKADGNGVSDAFVRDRGQPLGVAGVHAATGAGGRVEVSGRATYSGADLAAAPDPAGDAAGADTGSDLIHVRVGYRPEQADLLVAWRLASLPGVAVQDCQRTPTFPPFTACVDEGTGGGSPGVVYGLVLRVSATDYQIRAARSAGSPKGDFRLLRCEPDCVEAATLSGGIGTTGPEVTVSVPLAAVGAAEGTAVAGLRAYTAAGDASPAEPVTLDDTELPGGSLPGMRVQLGIVPSGASPDAADLGTAVNLERGRFARILDASGLPPGTFRVWARACLGERCGQFVPGSPDVAVPRIASSLDLAVEGEGGHAMLLARLTAPGTADAPIPGRTVTFSVDGTPLGEVSTDEAGVASLAVPPRYRGAHQRFQATFAGDHTYLPATDTATH